jgi:ribosomal-protein-alanine N-acetyltransferase
VLEEYAQGRDGPWVIELKSGHTVIGHIHLMDIDPQDRKAQVGFALAKAYWSQGIMTEALTQVLQFVFTQFGLDRVEAWPIRENRAAVRVLEKAGMHPEGEPRAELQKGALWDFCLYAIRRSEYSLV